MAFESLTDKFQLIIKKLKGETRLSEKNMDDMLKEVRVALLEADVNFKVVKEFTNHVKEIAVGQHVFDKLNPGQMVVKIVHDELENLLGSDESELHFVSPSPTIIMMVGLQGSGKTTTAGKLALLFKKKYNKKVLLCACDVYRPAAIEQLETIGKQIAINVFSLGIKFNPVDIAKKALEKAKAEHYDVLIVDTAGRLQIDDKLMDELSNIKDSINPHETLLLVDAMAGQDAVNVALAFNEKINLSGVVMSKLDGDARGGSALSIRKLTGVPIKFAGVGEKLSDLDEFHPDRMADRILGMGDIMTLVEKAQSEMNEKEMKKSVNKMMEGQFGLDDMLTQLRQIKNLGSLGGIVRLIPGMPKLTDEQKEKAEKEMKDTETIINSMTYEEKRNPSILKNSRKVRIAKGSGMTNTDVNKVLKKYEQMKQASKMIYEYKKSGKIPPGMSGMGF